MRDVNLELQDLRYLNWAKTRKSSGTAGSFLKAYDDSGKTKVYYKLSDFDQAKGIVGHECINEIVVQRLLRLFGIDHLSYTLVHALVHIDGKEYETYLCSSDDFKQEGESKIAFEDYYVIEKDGDESHLEFCKRKGWERSIYEMILIDYLVLNRDRHGANLEVLRNKKLKTDRLAPLFDHGLSLVCRCHSKQELDAFDVLEDKDVNSFIGTRSAFENVRLIPKEFLRALPELKEKDLDSLFEGMENLLDNAYYEKMREMIWKRWESLDRI